MIDLLKVIFKKSLQSSQGLDEKVGKQEATLAAEQAMLEAKHNVLREALAAVLEREVSLPAAMLVSTMRHLSTWGQSLGATMRCRQSAHWLRDRTASHSKSPQLGHRPDFSDRCRLNIAGTCCHGTGLCDHQLHAHACKNS
jgi:hypothetical protein